MRSAAFSLVETIQLTRRYTTFTEGCSSDEVFTTLNEYFSLMVKEINRYGGVIDKFIGDAVMAVFGVPKHDPDHASQACRAALAMHSKLREYNARRTREGRPVIKIGVGVGTGDVHFRRLIKGASAGPIKSHAFPRK